MANRRDGGTVVIGVEEVGGGLTASGLSSEQIATWTFDDVAAGLGTYADPSVEFDLSRIQHGSGGPCVVLEVRPFGDVPVLCKREYSYSPGAGRTEVVLRRGACYVRSRSRLETSEILSFEDMRDLLDLATERRLRAFFAQSVRAGVDMSRLAAATDDGRYATEAEQAPNDVVDLIHTRGNWRVIIRPEEYIEQRIQNIHELPMIVRRNEVRLGGWTFPHVPGEALPEYGEDRVAQYLDWGHRLESWQFHQSGQFIHQAGIPEDWRDHSEIWPAPVDWRSGTSLGVCDTLWRFTGAFELAARMAATVPGDDALFVELTGNGMRGRHLYGDNDECQIRFDHAHVSNSDTISYKVTVSRGDVMAQAAEYAVQGATDVFRRCGWWPRPEWLRDWQDAFRRP